MSQPRRTLSLQLRLPLEYQAEFPLSENVKAEAVRALADLLLEAASQLPTDSRGKKGTRDESKDQA